MHVMMDIETLGTAPHSAVIEVGAVAFELKSRGKVMNHHAFRRNVLVQEGAGSVDHGTLCFWMQQVAQGSPMVYRLMNDAEPLDQVLIGLDLWLKNAEWFDGDWDTVQGVWCRGPQFDVANLTDKYRRVGRDCPWHYSLVRDQRTFMDAMGVNPKDLTIDTTGFEAHGSVDDCLYQIAAMQMALGVRDGRTRR